MADKNVKKRHWAFVLYTESAPEDWLEQLQMTGVKFSVSPYHDKDVYTDGEKKGLPKKPHYHIILSYGSTTTFRNVENLTKRLNQPIPQGLESVVGYYRYFTHMDHPDKYQYDAAEIRSYNGFDIGDFVELSKTEVLKIMRAMMDYIRENDLMEYADLMDMTMCEGIPPEWFDVAASHTLFFTGYLKSRRFRVERRERNG